MADRITIFADDRQDIGSPSFSEVDCEQGTRLKPVWAFLRHAPGQSPMACRTYAVGRAGSVIAARERSR
jgi:hypothetical protein